MMMAAGMNAAGLPRATFVGFTTQVTPGSGASNINIDFASVSGLQVGDYAFVCTVSPSSSTYASLNGAAWNADNYTWTPGYGYKSTVFHRQIVAADLTLPRVLTSANDTTVSVFAYRGPTSAIRQVISFDDDGGATQVVPGLTRDWECIGVFCQLFDRDVDVLTYTVSGGWTKRINTVLGAWAPALADALGASDYVDGASLTWGNLGTSGPFAQVAQMYELRK